jgi:GNAT superfamily N-acetyltransferase
MSDLIVRRATDKDAAILAALIDGFAKGHPAEGHPRSDVRMRDAFFGSEPVAHIVLAEKNATVIGFGAWRKTYDLFWSVYGGEGIGLYVIPSHRGRGVAVCIVAAMCEEIREHGGHFLQASYVPDLGPLYERVGVGRPERACHVSARAFEVLASLSGRSARDIVRALPNKTLNHLPVDA